jgi:GH43 family beta-xylosidase
MRPDRNSQYERSRAAGHEEEGKGTNICIEKMSSPGAITGKVTLLLKPDHDESPAVRIRHGKLFMASSASAIDANYSRWTRAVHDHT